MLAHTVMAIGLAQMDPTALITTGETYHLEFQLPVSLGKGRTPPVMFGLSFDSPKDGKGGTLGSDPGLLAKILGAKPKGTTTVGAAVYHASGTMYNFGINVGYRSISNLAVPSSWFTTAGPVVYMPPFVVKVDRIKDPNGKLQNEATNPQGATNSQANNAVINPFVDIEGATVVTDPDAIAGILGSIGNEKPEIVLPLPAR